MATRPMKSLDLNSRTRRDGGLGARIAGSSRVSVSGKRMANGGDLHFVWSGFVWSGFISSGFIWSGFNWSGFVLPRLGLSGEFDSSDRSSLHNLFQEPLPEDFLPC